MKASCELSVCMWANVWYKTIWPSGHGSKNMGQTSPSVQVLSVRWDLEQAFNMQLLNSEPYKHKGTDNMAQINNCSASGTLPHVQFSWIKRSFRPKEKTATAEIYLRTCLSLIKYLLSPVLIKRRWLYRWCLLWPGSFVLSRDKKLTQSDEITAADWDTDAHFHR